MAAAIDTARLALEVIPDAQRQLDRLIGGRRRFQIYRGSVHATIPSHDSELWRQSRSAFHGPRKFDVLLSKQGALDWQADPDDDLGDAEVLHHLHQQAMIVPLLSSVISQRDHGNTATTLTGSALSTSVNSSTQGRPLTSYDRYSLRLSDLEVKKLVYDSVGISYYGPAPSAVDPSVGKYGIFSQHLPYHSSGFIVWARPRRYDNVVFLQLQWDVVDLFSQRTLPTSRPGKRRRTAFNPFLQVFESLVVDEPSRENPRPLARRFNGVRHRPDRKTWVAKMKPPKCKTKQDFGNFKSEVEAGRAVDAAYYHYGRPHLLNFPDTSVPLLSTRLAAPLGLDEKAKVKFVKEEAKLLLVTMAATSPLDSTPTNSLQIREPSASPRRCPSGHFRSLLEISWPSSCNDPEEVDEVVSQPQPGVMLDSICDISTIGVQTNWETLNSVQNAKQGWDWAGDSCTLAAPSNVLSPSAYNIQGRVWLDSLLRSPPAPTDWRSPSPNQFEEENAYALLEQPST